METMKTELAEEKVNSVDIKHFISLIRKCKNPTEISDAMFNELVVIRLWFMKQRVWEKHEHKRSIFILTMSVKWILPTPKKNLPR